MTAEQQNDDDAAAWGALRERWEDDAAHRAFLARFGDLEGLARAGALYRSVLAGAPGDAIALRWRDEVVRRATVAGLASLPRSAPAVPRLPRWVRPALVALLGAVVVASGFLLLRTLTTWGRP